VSKFYLIWNTIAKELNLGKGQILGEITFSRDPLPDNVRCDQDKVRHLVLSSKNPQSNIVQLYRTISSPTRQCLTEIFSLTLVHDFGHILLTEHPIDPIIFPLRS
jgi:hypothetical protein